jgi:hypothetical protein
MSYGYRDSRSIEYFNVIPGSARQRYAIFLKLIHYHLHHFVDVLESLFGSRTLRHGAILAQRRAVGVKTAFIWLHNHSESVRLHDLSIGFPISQ